MTCGAPAPSPGPPAAAEAGDTLGGGQPSPATAEFLDQTSDEHIENVSEEMNCEVARCEPPARQDAEPQLSESGNWIDDRYVSLDGIADGCGLSQKDGSTSLQA
ncbi:hypothetical protein MRX96_000209 [Rhipicephalus microplus]